MFLDLKLSKNKQNDMKKITMTTRQPAYTKRVSAQHFDNLNVKSSNSDLIQTKSKIKSIQQTPKETENHDQGFRNIFFTKKNY